MLCPRPAYRTTQDQRDKSSNPALRKNQNCEGQGTRLSRWGQEGPGDPANADGYKIMSPLAEKAIHQALK
jgi:hypothetical protein